MAALLPANRPNYDPEKGGSQTHFSFLGSLPDAARQGREVAQGNAAQLLTIARPTMSARPARFPPLFRDTRGRLNRTRTLGRLVTPRGLCGRATRMVFVHTRDCSNPPPLCAGYANRRGGSLKVPSLVEGRAALHGRAIAAITAFSNRRIPFVGRPASPR